MSKRNPTAESASPACARQNGAPVSAVAPHSTLWPICDLTHYARHPRRNAPRYLVDYEGANHPPNKSAQARAAQAKAAAEGKEKKGLTGAARPDHPTPKPLDGFAIPMRQPVPLGGLCYEPFSGGGSQIMAGEANRRWVYAMEIRPVQVEVAILRFQKYFPDVPVVLDGAGTSYAQTAVERRGTI